MHTHTVKRLSLKVYTEFDMSVLPSAVSVLKWLDPPVIAAWVGVAVDSCKPSPAIDGLPCLGSSALMVWSHIKGVKNIGPCWPSVFALQCSFSPSVVGKTRQLLYLVSYLCMACLEIVLHALVCIEAFISAPLPSAGSGIEDCSVSWPDVVKGVCW